MNDLDSLKDVFIENLYFEFKSNLEDHLKISGLAIDGFWLFEMIDKSFKKAVLKTAQPILKENGYIKNKNGDLLDE